MLVRFYGTDNSVCDLAAIALALIADKEEAERSEPSPEEER